MNEERHRKEPEKVGRCKENGKKKVEEDDNEVGSKGRGKRLYASNVWYITVTILKGLNLHFR